MPLSLVVVHFLSDFVLQNDWMALNKSKRWWPLTAHVLVYATPFLWWGWRFALVTFLVGVGADQVLHYVALAATYGYFSTRSSAGESIRLITGRSLVRSRPRRP